VRRAAGQRQAIVATDVGGLAGLTVDPEDRVLGRAIPRRWRPSAQAARKAVVDSGHYRTVTSGRPVDRTGRAIPWYSYPAIAWLDRLDFAGRSVFEWGVGSSTAYWLRRGAQVRGVDVSPDWQQLVSKETDVPVLLATDEATYVAAPSGRFDVVCIDGSWRDACANTAPHILADGGMIVFDNSDRHPDALRRLRERGFVQVDFFGVGPINGYPWTTSVLLRGQLAIPHPDLPAADY
jgi:hypothetical protein